MRGSGTTNHQPHIQRVPLSVCKYSFHEETREENILVIYLLCEAFLDAIASLHLIMSVSQSVSQSVSHITLSKYNKEDLYKLHGHF